MYVDCLSYCIRLFYLCDFKVFFFKYREETLLDLLRVYQFSWGGGRCPTVMQTKTESGERGCVLCWMNTELGLKSDKMGDAFQLRCHQAPFLIRL